MVLKEGNNAGTTGHVLYVVEKEQWHASACKLAMQMVCLVDSKSFQKLAFHLRSSYVAFEVFGNELPLQPVHPSYCILSL